MKQEVNIRIGEQIRQYLESKGLQQQDVANRLGISQSAVSAYYRGKPIGKNAAHKWEEVFGFRSTWLILGEGSMLLEEKSNQDAPIPEQTASGNPMIDYLQRKIAELESKVDKLNDEKAELLQENAILKYENMMLSPKGDAEDVASSSSASAV